MECPKWDKDGMGICSALMYMTLPLNERALASDVPIGGGGRSVTGAPPTREALMASRHRRMHPRHQKGFSTISSKMLRRGAE